MRPSPSALETWRGGTARWPRKVVQAGLGNPFLIILCPYRRQPWVGKTGVTWLNDKVRNGIGQDIHWTGLRLLRQEISPGLALKAGVNAGHWKPNRPEMNLWLQPVPQPARGHSMVHTRRRLWASTASCLSPAMMLLFTIKLQQSPNPSYMIYCSVLIT